MTESVKIVQQLRDYCGFRPSVIARLVGVTPASVHNWLIEKSRPSPLAEGRILDLVRPLKDGEPPAGEEKKS